MRVLVIGSGGREHALCYRLRQSSSLSELFILPGNAGTAALGTNVAGPADEPSFVVELARRERIDLVVVGPEDPLAAGLVDALVAAGIRAFGPTGAAARLEADKAYAKQLMRRHSIPTAEARMFEHYEHAREYIATRDEALVVKAAGLAKGKGAIVCDDPAEAIIAAENMLVKKVFGAAGETIVVEEKLLGQETSLLAVVDGRTAYWLEPAQDYKRLGDGDAGPNTGGMGCYCPSTNISPAMMQSIEEQILIPTLDALIQEGVHYTGVLYIGLMLTAAGPKVLEYNCRFGDPETQVLMMRMESDLLTLMNAAVDHRLESVDVRWDAREAVCVVLASEGYPEQYPQGRPIHGLDALRGLDDVTVFHAGTARKGDQVMTAGGRVLGVTALGATRAAARQRAYEAVEQIRFEGAQYRTDIGA